MFILILDPSCSINNFEFFPSTNSRLEFQLIDFDDYNKKADNIYELIRIYTKTQQTNFRTNDTELISRCKGGWEMVLTSSIDLLDELENLVNVTYLKSSNISFMYQLRARIRIAKVICEVSLLEFSQTGIMNEYILKIIK